MKRGSEKEKEGATQECYRVRRSERRWEKRREKRKKRVNRVSAHKKHLFFFGSLFLYPNEKKERGKRKGKRKGARTLN